MASPKKTVPKPAKGRKTLTPAANLPVGKGALRQGHKIIKIYGEFKVGKTHGVAGIEGAHWIVADSNCIPTLEEIGKLPPREHLHEVSSLEECKAVCNAFLDAAEANKKAGKEPLGIPAIILDSDTIVSEWHQADVADETSQRYMGENQKDNGWQKFNADFGAFIDKLVELGRYTNVIIIGHAAAKIVEKKGKYAGFALTPAMAAKVGRAVNWILYQTREVEPFGESDTLIDGLDTVVEHPDGKMRERRIYNTMPRDGYIACASPSLFPTGVEPVDLKAMLEKAGAL